MGDGSRTMRYGERFRHTIQTLWALLTNSYLKGFATGRIYQGRLKNLCVPGLNCYSCPGALGSCPIGALQAVIGSRHYTVAFYVVGFLMFIGAFVGRAVCGWLCPFGLIQDLLHKIPFPAKVRTFRGDRLLRRLKYGILMIFVILLPLMLTDLLGQGTPYFCKLICPVGTLEGGIPLVLMNEGLRGAIGFLYAWKSLILALTILLAILIYRPFCKYICPLGAVYSIFNPIAIFRYRIDPNRCVRCGNCARVCQMGCNPLRNANDTECIRCGKCRQNCMAGAIHAGFRQDQK